MSTDTQTPSDPWLMDTPDASDSPVEQTFADDFYPPQVADDDLLPSADRLPDSQQYIKSLERKLDKLKGKTKESSSRDVILSLEKKRDGLLEQFLSSQQDHPQDYTFDVDLSNDSLYSLIERRLFPKQAMTAEELEALVKADLLQKVAEDRDGEENDKDGGQSRQAI